MDELHALTTSDSAYADNTHFIPPFQGGRTIYETHQESYALDPQRLKSSRS